MCIELKSKLIVNYCVDDYDHRHFENANSLSIEFASAEVLEDFFALAVPVLMSKAAAGDGNDCEVPAANLNMTTDTLNLSVVSRSFHNGELDARFSYMGDTNYDTDRELDTDQEAPNRRRPREGPSKGVSVQQPRKPKNVAIKKPVPHPKQTMPAKSSSASTSAAVQVVVVPPAVQARKRKLHSNEVYETSAMVTRSQSSAASAQGSSSSSPALVIVMNEEDIPDQQQQQQQKKKKQTKSPAPVIINSATQVLSTPTPSKSIFKTAPNARVPIYRTVLDDWNSTTAHSPSSYTFVCNDPPATKKGRPARASAPGGGTGKAAAATVTRAARANKTMPAKRAPPRKKMPLDFVRKIVKRPCREAAKEAKIVFGLKDTPPYHGHGWGSRAEEQEQAQQEEGQRENANVTAEEVVEMGPTTSADESQVVAVPVADNNQPPPISSLSDDTKMMQTLMDGFYTGRRSTGFDKGKDVEQERESYLVFMQFVEQYRTLSTQMVDVMQGIRKL